MKAWLTILALSLLVPLAGLTYFFSQNPFEFSIGGCVPSDVGNWFDVLMSGCLDVDYAAKFVLIYGLTLFVLLVIAWGAYRVLLGKR